MIPAYLSPLANHLWQSTLFAALAGLLTLAFRKNRAAVRYGLWLAASCKFLIPFSFVVSLGSQLEWPTPRAAAPAQFSFVMQGISEPFARPAVASPRSAVPPKPNRVPAILLSIWLCGFTAGVFSWLRRWRRIRAAVQAASPLHLDMPIGVPPIPVRIMSSAMRLEPGVFGIHRPVLLLPEGITNRLIPAQLETIVAHELWHVRRRDNLAAAMHMLVEAVFWFHPLVWWIETRLLEERERACDEQVLRFSEPHVYAEAILNVCKLYLDSRLLCVAGVTGSNLRKRIEAIMTHRITHKVNLSKRLLLAAAGIAAVAGPIAVGIRAQSQPAPHLAFEVTSVKQNKSADWRGMGIEFLPGGRFKATNVPLLIVIATAYDVPFQSSRLSGGPDWIRSDKDKYDIEASAEKDAIPAGSSVKARDEKIKWMLQSLLADRFKLIIRRETKELPVYALVVGKNGPKLQKSKIEEKDCPEVSDGNTGCHQFMGGQGRGLHGKAVDMSDMALFVGNWTDRPLLDRTGIKGLFEIDTDGWVPIRPRLPVAPGADPSPEDIAMSDPTRPTLYMIFDRLGLKMESSKGPVDMFVIDHVEKPTEN
jgi:bla regulator protein BlaR1